MWKATERGIGRLDVDLITFGVVVERSGSDGRQLDSDSGQAQP